MDTFKLTVRNCPAYSGVCQCGMPAHSPAGRVINVTVEGIPEGFTDDDVRWNIERLAESGDVVARLALLNVTLWLSVNDGSTAQGVRCYLDD